MALVPQGESNPTYEGKVASIKILIAGMVVIKTLFFDVFLLAKNRKIAIGDIKGTMEFNLYSAASNEIEVEKNLLAASFNAFLETNRRTVDGGTVLELGLHQLGSDRKVLFYELFDTYVDTLTPPYTP